MSKHTTGPWHAWDRGIGWEVHAGIGTTCEMKNDADCRGPINGEFRETFTEADARLIATAPELLNALRWSINHEGECLGDYPEILEAAKTLLAKVEGTER